MSSFHTPQIAKYCINRNTEETHWGVDHDFSSQVEICLRIGSRRALTALQQHTLNKEAWAHIEGRLWCSYKFLHPLEFILLGLTSSTELLPATWENTLVLLLVQTATLSREWSSVLGPSTGMRIVDTMLSEATGFLY